MQERYWAMKVSNGRKSGMIAIINQKYRPTLARAFNENRNHAAEYRSRCNNVTYRKQIACQQFWPELGAWSSL